MGQKIGFILILGLIGLMLLASSLFTVDQREAVIRFQFGQAVETHTEPGLYFKMPLIQNIVRFDRRIQTLDEKEAERVNTVEKKNVLVDSFVKYRIVDVLGYFRAVGSNDPSAVQRRLQPVINNAIRAEFGTRTLNELVSGERDKTMAAIRDRVKDEGKTLGIEVVDVRIKRIDYVAEVSDRVYERMRTERRRVAADLRATGEGEKEKIKAEADKQAEIILAEAYREAQRKKGEGDGKAAAIYAEAHSKNPEFFSFYRSLEAYRATMQNKSDVMVLDPSSDFFKYMKDPSKKR
jgi:modulator of FtsH protease HflC